MKRSTFEWALSLIEKHPNDPVTANLCDMLFEASYCVLCGDNKHMWLHNDKCYWIGIDDRQLHSARSVKSEEITELWKKCREDDFASETLLEIISASTRLMISGPIIVPIYATNSPDHEIAAILIDEEYVAEYNVSGFEEED